VSCNMDEFRELGYRAVDLAAHYLASLPDGPVFQRMPEEARQAITSMSLPADAISGDEILRLLEKHILPHPMGNGHPRFFGWVNSPPAPMAIVTEILAAAMNPSCAGGDHAAIYLEHCVIRWLMELIGFPTGGSAGILVSGGSAAALTALAAARHRVLARLGIDVRRQGVSAAPGRLRLYACAQGHSCHQKAVELLGLGSVSIRWIEVDAAFRMSPEHLRRAIEEDRRQGWHPLAIVANAGSVNTGAIDPLDALAEVADAESVWLHVDGAYGVAGMLDPATKPLFGGLDRADSIALDPHKWLSVPVECGCVLVRDGALLRDTFSLVPPYLRTEPGKGFGNLPWFAEYGFQQTRGFRALKLWAAIMHAGTKGIAERVARQIALARCLEERIASSNDLELCTRGRLSIVCFRFVPTELAGNDTELNQLNQEIMAHVQASGKAFLTNTMLNGRFWLRACILHYATTEADLDALLEAVRSAASSPSCSQR